MVVVAVGRGGEGAEGKRKDKKAELWAEISLSLTPDVNLHDATKVEREVIQRRKEPK
jgi:hypothetical protein